MGLSKLLSRRIVIIAGAALSLGAALDASADIGGSASAPGNSSSGGGMVVSAPCSAAGDSSGFQRKCADVISGVPGQGGYTGPTGALPALDATIRGLVDNPVHSLYQGEIVDQSSPADALKTEYFGKPVCALTPNPFNNGLAETSTNHLGESCGTPAKITVHASASAGIQTVISMDKPYGTEEAAYTRGLWVQSLTCYWQQVRAEIKNTGRVRLSGSCQALGENIQNMGRQADAIVQKLRGNLATSANIAELGKCSNSLEELKEKDGASNDLAGDGTQSVMRQGVQHLCAARAGIEALFTQMAVCETFARAGKAYRAVVTDPEAFLDEIKDTVAKTCQRQCNHECSGCMSESSCSSCGTSCGNRCYGSEIRNFFVSKQKAWPSNGSCQ